jgi:hypothetical protein
MKKYYVGMDVHQASIVIAVINARGLRGNGIDH